MHHLHGNVFDDTAPPAYFKEWLVGPLFQWADTPEKRSAASAWSLLSVDGARTGLEMKLSRLRAGNNKGDRPESPGVTTLGIVICGFMQIELIERSTQVGRTFDLNTEGAFLAWHSTAYTHRWAAKSDCMVVTVRWSEHAACTRES
jgi:hypothetical protein